MQCFKEHLVVSLQGSGLCLLLSDVSGPFEVHQLYFLLLKVGLQSVNQRYISFKASNWWLGLPQRRERLSRTACSSCLGELGRVERRVSLVLVWLSRLPQGGGALVVSVFKHGLRAFICIGRGVS